MILPGYILPCLWLAALIFGVLTVFSIRRYGRQRSAIKELVNRSVKCEAEVLNPVVPNDAYFNNNLHDASKILSDFQNISVLLPEYTCTEVRFIADDAIVQTMVLRQVSIRNPKIGDPITVYYDPYDPRQSFCEDMRCILLHKPLRDCIIHGTAAVVLLLSAIFLAVA